MDQYLDKGKCHSDTDLTSMSAPQTSGGEKNRKRKQPTSDWTDAINSLSNDFKNTLNDLRKDMEAGMLKISSNILSMKDDLASLNQVMAEMRNDMNCLRTEQTVLRHRVTELDTKCEILSDQFVSIQESFQFMTDDNVDVKTKVGHLSQQTQEALGLKSVVAELTSKIDFLEQSARNCNIEICNIPERRNENLLSLMQRLSSEIKCNIHQNDIISINRVPHAHQQNNKPKNIIVKLCSRILRDNILSAHRLCKGLTTDKLGISGAPAPVYMHEHLTLKNKQLFRESRDAAKEHNYKFIWVKNGIVLVREKEGTKAVAIRSRQDIAKIKPGFGSINVDRS